jgi:hypothetical protein
VFGETKPKPKQQPADVLEKRNETETAPELTPHETKRNRNEPISMPENRPFRFTHEFLVLLLTLTSILSRISKLDNRNFYRSKRSKSPFVQTSLEPGLKLKLQN